MRAPVSNGMDQSAAVGGRSIGLDEVQGQVLEIDREEGTLRVLDEDEGEVELRVRKGIPVFFEGGVSSFAEIAEGSPVRAAFEEEGREKVATWVEIPRPGPSQRPAREPLEPAEGEVAEEPTLD